MGNGIQVPVPQSTNQHTQPGRDKMFNEMRMDNERFTETRVLDNLSTYSVVNVSTVLADPFTLPILGFLFLLSCFLSGGLFVTKDHVQ